MKEGIPYYQYLNEFQTQFLNYYLKNDENVDAVELLFTPLSGRFTVFYSKTIEYPTLQQNDDSTNLDYKHVIKITKSDSSDLTGNYYLGVTANQTGILIITPVL